ncbi:MAG: glycoside hydrolase family 127 protein [Planctomycetota bacterium]
MTPNIFRVLITFVVALFAALPAMAGERGVLNTSKSPHVVVRNIDLGDARWTDGFWAERFELNNETTIPTMHAVMELPDNTATFHNLRVAAGEKEGAFSGNAWSDGDCYKLIEAMAAAYAITKDPKLDQTMDELIAVIAKAQAPDGYISTQIQLTDKGRWTEVKHHELYNMGHLLTAACIHHRVTGKEGFLNVARKLADYLYTTFEPRPKELAHFGFNPSNCMGAAELYRTTGDRKYLKLANIFVSMRGSQPGGPDQNQARIPLRRETEAVGHAVTGPYLWCGAADLYAETGEQALFDALNRLWEDVTFRKMYITGGIGALHQGISMRRELKAWDKHHVHEAFGAEYELPNRTAYNETCANISNAMWNFRLLGLTGDAKYADVMERVLYNSMLSALALDGEHFFYTNPLKRYGKDVPLLSNDSYERWPDTTPRSPLKCFCCPPSVARTLAELPGWAYGVSDGALWVHLYGSSELKTTLPDGGEISVRQKTNYPWDGTIAISVPRAPKQETALQLRIPGWAKGATLTINGEPAGVEVKPGSYASIERVWQPEDRIELQLPMEVAMVQSHPLVEANRGQVAVMRGPIVYCLESVDLPEVVSIDDVRIPRDAAWHAEHRPDLLGGVTALSTSASVVPGANRADLYAEIPAGAPRTIPLTLIPYYAWNNRGTPEMTVWIPLE